MHYKTQQKTSAIIFELKDKNPDEQFLFVVDFIGSLFEWNGRKIRSFLLRLLTYWME